MNSDIYQTLIVYALLWGCKGKSDLDITFKQFIIHYGRKTFTSITQKVRSGKFIERVR